jgi:hypothetical protein
MPSPGSSARRPSAESDGWADAGNGVSSTVLKSALRYGSGYLFRLRATDGWGNVGGPADGPVVTPTLHADGSTLATYGPAGP